MMGMALRIVVALLLVALPCQAKNHLWRFTEFFSNASGTIQFIEMQECCGSNEETLMANTEIQSNANQFDFPNHLSGPTAHRWIIIATQGFAALPGAPTPDYIMPDRFFEPTGDTLRYRFGTTDVITLAAGQLPLDGVHSIDRSLATNQLTLIVNNPINFAGVEGSISIPPGIPIATPLLWWLGAGGVAAVGVARLRRRAHQGASPQKALARLPIA
jgi:hypothetical protein